MYLIFHLFKKTQLELFIILGKLHVIFFSHIQLLYNTRQIPWVLHDFVDCIYIVFGWSLRSDLSRQYKAKMSELDLKRTEVMRLSTDYEVKMKKKEVCLI